MGWVVSSWYLQKHVVWALSQDEESQGHHERGYAAMAEVSSAHRDEPST